MTPSVALCSLLRPNLRGSVASSSSARLPALRAYFPARPIMTVGGNSSDMHKRRSKPPIPVIRDLTSLRRWRQQMRSAGRTVGVVPTMGALHDGHLSLVRASMAGGQEQATVVTVFVNPTQFAPHEDLAAYPRTMERDLELLDELQQRDGGEVVVFAPDGNTMYPLSSLQGPTDVEGGEGMLQDTTKQRGAFVEVKGWGDVLEGKSRRESRESDRGGHC